MKHKPLRFVGLLMVMLSVFSVGYGQINASSSGTNVSCNGGSNGAINLTVSGGVTPYHYTWSTGATTQNLANLAAGTYAVTISDSGGGTSGPFNWTYTNTGSNHTILVPFPDALINGQTIDVGDYIGVFFLVSGSPVCGGYIEYQGYSDALSAWGDDSTTPVKDGFSANEAFVWKVWRVSNGQTVNMTATYDLTSGFFPNGGTFVANGMSGCSLSGTAATASTTTLTNIILTQPSALTATIVGTNVTTNGGNNGAADLTVGGGTAPYTYLWSNSAVSQDLTNLIAGTYAVTVTDANGCTKNASVTITQPAGQLPLSASITGTNLICNGVCTGVADLTPTGGVTPYTYMWSNGANTQDLNGLCAGTYSVTVSDGSGSAVTGPFNWTYTNTGSNHTILVPFPDALINGQSIAVGDYIGVFFLVSGVPTCGGYIQYQGFSDALSAWGDDSTTPVKDGFSANEAFIWKVWRASDGQTVTMTATYDLTSGFFPNGGNFVANGMSGCSLTGTAAAAGATTTASVVITQPSLLVASSSATTIACFGGNAVVTVSATGGTAPYSGTGTFTRAAGTYTFTVTDANGCTATTEITVNQPAQLVSSSVASPINCFGGTSTIVVSATGGTAPYTGTGSFVVSAGSYSYTVTDSHGCTAVTQITVNQPSQLVASSSASPINCFGGTSTVVVSATGGTAPYSGTGSFTVVAGSYSFTVTDSNGCTSVTSGVVDQPAQLVASAENTPILCFGQTSTVVVSAVGGTAPYNGTGTFEVGAGVHEYMVTDARQCVSVVTVNITEPAALEAWAEATPILCNGGMSVVSIFAAGGTAPYIGIGTEEVYAGTHTHGVTDANGCSVSFEVVVTEPAALMAHAEFSPIMCHGGYTYVTVSGMGGTEPYTGTGSFEIGAGNYTYEVVDANGCIATVSIEVTEPAALVVIAEATPILCNGGTSVVTVSATGGTDPYYGTGTFDVVAGTYTYNVYDAHQCAGSVTIEVTEPAALEAWAEATPILCNGGMSVVSIFAAGGTAPYIGIGTEEVYAGTHTHVVTDANGCSVSFEVVVTEPAALMAHAEFSPIMCHGGYTYVTVSGMGGTEPYTGTGTFEVGAGNYTYEVVDANGCVATVSIEVTEPAALVVTAEATPILCHGGMSVVTVSATGGTAPYYGIGSFEVVAGSYSYTVYDANQCAATVSIEVAEPAPLMASYIATPILCNGGTSVVTISAEGGVAPYTGTGSFDLTAGFHSFEVFDANGCSTSIGFLIMEPMPLMASSFVGDIDCHGGIAQVDIYVNGGTYPYTGDGSYQLGAGTYTFDISDANGCSTSIEVVVTEPSQLVASATFTAILCNGMESMVNVSATGGTEPYSGTGMFPVNAGTHTFVVTDANGCSSEVTVVIEEPAPLFVEISNTPILCYGGQSMVTATIYGGTAPYSFINMVLPGYTFTGPMPAGMYPWFVFDANQCAATGTLFITQPDELVLSAAPVHVSTYQGADGSIDLTVAGGTAPFTFAWSNGEVTEDLVGLVAGTYSVVVTDANGCSASISVEVSQPSAPEYLSGSGYVSQVNCFGVCNGAIDLSVIGGLPPYTFAWSNGANTEDVAGLCAGIYTVTVSDSGTGTVYNPFDWTFTNTGSSHIILVQATTQITIDGQPISVGDRIGVFFDRNGEQICGSGVLTDAGMVWDGNQNYVTAWGDDSTTPLKDGFNNGETFQWKIWRASDGQEFDAVATYMPSFAFGGSMPNEGTFAANGLSGIESLVAVSNGGGTGAASQQIVLSFEVTEPTALTATVSATTILCNGGTSVVTVVAEGGTAPYTGTGTFEVVAGTYEYLVTDANYCQTLVQITVTEPEVLVASAEYLPVLCNGDATFVHVSAVGGTEPYTGVGTFEVFAGTYEYVVTDANGCSSTVSVTINQPEPLVAAAHFDPILCHGGMTTVWVEAVGGVAPYTGIGGFEVSAGTYGFVVTDINGCEFVFQVNVPEPEMLTATAEVSPIACNGGMATVVVSATGGAAPYTGIGTFDVVAGSYIFPVFDLNGCQTSVTVEISQPEALVVTAEFLPILCHGESTFVGVNATGGTEPYTGTGVYEVFAGSYTYGVTDANGCYVSVNVDVVEPEVLSVSALFEPILCNGGSTVVNVEAMGGTAPYMGAGSFAVNAGFYGYVITDANGCEALVEVVVTEPELLVVSGEFTPIACHGGVSVVTVNAFGGTAPYTGVGTFDLGAGNYTFPVVDANGCQASIFFEITQPEMLEAFASFDPILCNGGTTLVSVNAVGGVAPYAGVGVFELGAGNFEFVVTDANGCTYVVPVSIAQPEPLAASATSTPILCNGGTSIVTISAIGGTMPYTGVGTFEVSTGSHAFPVVDANGCVSYAFFVITAPEPLWAGVTATPVLCNGDLSTVIVSATGGTEPYTGTGSFELGAGSYTFPVYDANGCQTSVSVDIVEPTALEVSAQYAQGICEGQMTSVVVNAFGGTEPYSGIGTFEVAPGTYVYEVVDGNGCTASVNVTIQAFPVPVVELGADLAICAGQTATLDAGIQDYYLWSTGEMSQSILVSEEGTYSVVVTNVYGCQASDFVHVTVKPLPLPDLGPDVELVFGNSLTLNPGTFDGYLWSTGSTMPTLVVNAAGTYFVEVMLNGCFASDAVVVTIIIPEQVIPMTQGYNLISTYMNPFNPAIANVFSGIVSSVKIVKNQYGSVYWPQFGLNNIGNMVLGQAYEVTMLSANTLVVYGIACDPANTHLNLHTGWNHLGYLRLYQAPINLMMAPIAGTFQFVKNGLGQVYWPAFNFNGIGNMKPGFGYRINMYSAQVFTYPANSMVAKAEMEPAVTSRYTGLTLTGNDMTLGIPEEAWTIAPSYGDEVGVFAANGTLVGSGVYESGNVAISIFGDELNSTEIEGLVNGQEFMIRLFSNGREENLEVTNWTAGTGRFATDQVSIVGKLQPVAQSENLSLGQNFPNPVSTTTEIAFYLPESGFVTLSVYNILGEKLTDVVSKVMPAGNHKVTFDARDLSIGNYLYKLSTANGEQTRVMNVVK